MTTTWTLTGCPRWKPLLLIHRWSRNWYGPSCHNSYCGGLLQYWTTSNMCMDFCPRRPLAFTLYTTWQSMWTSTLAANWWGTCGHTAVKKEAIETVSETLMKGQMVVWSFAIQCDVMWYRLHWETRPMVSETLMKGQMVVWSFAIQCDVMWYRLHWETGDTADVRFELNPRVKKEGALSEGVFRSVMLWVCFIWGVFVPGGFVGIWILWCVYVCGLPTLVVVSSYTWCGVV